MRYEVDAPWRAEITLTCREVDEINDVLIRCSNMLAEVANIWSGGFGLDGALEYLTQAKLSMEKAVMLGDKYSRAEDAKFSAPPPVPKAGQKSADAEAALHCYGATMDDAEIAEMVGCSRSLVARLRKKVLPLAIPPKIESNKLT